MFRLTNALLLGGCLALMVGCGGGEKPVAADNSEIGKVRALVISIGDHATSLTNLATIMTKEAAPNQAKLQAFKDHTYVVDGDPVISGNTATMQMKIGTYGSEATSAATWKAVKEGEEWKLAETPMK